MIVVVELMIIAGADGAAKDGGKGLMLLLLFGCFEVAAGSGSGNRRREMGAAEDGRRRGRPGKAPGGRGNVDSHCAVHHQQQQSNNPDVSVVVGMGEG